MIKTILHITLVLFLLSCNSCKKKETEDTNDYKEFQIHYCNSFFSTGIINNNVNGVFLIDNASVSILDSCFLENNKIETNIQDSAIIVGTSGIDNAPTSNSVSISIFNELLCPKWVIYDLKKHRPNIDGVVGVDFFINKIIGLNFVSNSLIIYNNYTPSSDFSKFPLKTIDNRIYIEANVIINPETQINGFFLIDIGSEHCITLNSFVCDSLDLYNKIYKKIDIQIPNGSLTNETNRFLIKAQETRLNNISIKNLLVSCSLNKNGATGDYYKFFYGIIGNLFLENFDVIIDMKNNNLYLRPNSNYLDNFNVFKSGIFISDKLESGYKVKNVLRSFPGDISGIQNDDIIMQINNISTTELSYLEVLSLLNRKSKIFMKISRDNKIIEKTVIVTNLMDRL